MQVIPAQPLVSHADNLGTSVKGLGRWRAVGLNLAGGSLPGGGMSAVLAIAAEESSVPWRTLGTYFLLGSKLRLAAPCNKPDLTTVNQCRFMAVSLKKFP